MAGEVLLRIMSVQYITIYFVETNHHRVEL